MASQFGNRCTFECTCQSNSRHVSVVKLIGIKTPLLLSCRISCMHYIRIFMQEITILTEEAGHPLGLEDELMEAYEGAEMEKREDGHVAPDDLERGTGLRGGADSSLTSSSSSSCSSELFRPMRWRRRTYSKDYFITTAHTQPINRKRAIKVEDIVKHICDSN